LFRLIGAEIEISLDIHAKAPKGIDADLQRAARENCNVLEFEGHGMEEE